MFTITQYPLPYATDALAPYISQETLETHHGRHVATYIDNLNKLIENTPYADLSLIEIIKESANKPEDKKIFNLKTILHKIIRKKKEKNAAISQRAIETLKNSILSKELAFSEVEDKIVTCILKHFNNNVAEAVEQTGISKNRFYKIKDTK